VTLIIIYRLIKERHYVLTEGVAISDVTNAFFYKSTDYIGYLTNYI